MANREELALIRRARLGEAQAQLALGKLYLAGSASLPHNPATALHWLDRAAQQGLAAAWEVIGQQIPLAVVLQSGQALAMCTWYERASDAGSHEAGLTLAQLVLNHLPDEAVPVALRRKALLALSAAARAGLAQAQWLLARHQNDAGNDSGIADVPEARAWASQAAAGGVGEAQQVLMDAAWERADWDGFLQWALPRAAGLIAQSEASPRDGLVRPADVRLLVRCAQALAATGAHADGGAGAEQARQCWELAAQWNDPQAQWWIGLWYAHMDEAGERNHALAGPANFKKAVRFLQLAAEQGVAVAWFALSRIYLKAEFSQRNLEDAQRYLERAAELGHAMAQFECGMHAWRNRREQDEHDVKAVFWLQKAAGQGVAAATALLEKITPDHGAAAWAMAAGRLLTPEMANSHPFLAARIELAQAFALSRAECLLMDIKQADRQHCLVIDIRAYYGRSKRRLVQVKTAAERQLLDRVGRLFADVDSGFQGPEGNYRQRLYRLKTCLPHLDDRDE